jgi:glucose dehydrogenase
LQDITTGNVKDLNVAWTFSIADCTARCAKFLRGSADIANSCGNTDEASPMKILRWKRATMLSDIFLAP